MSLLDHLKTRRLCWNGDHGTAQYDDVFRELTVKPELPFEMVRIDCEPDVQCYLVVHDKFHGEVEMTPPEVEAVMNWLRCFADALLRRK